MANHLEDLVAEWLEYNGYFVRKSVLVGPLAHGGFEGELDVVGWHPSRNHLVHVECSLDADPWAKREVRFEAKFDRGRRFVPKLFPYLTEPLVLDQVALLQLGGGDRQDLVGARLIWVPDFIADLLGDLSKMDPRRSAIPSTYPLLRTVQLAAQPAKKRKTAHRLIEREMQTLGL